MLKKYLNNKGLYRLAFPPGHYARLKKGVIIHIHDIFWPFEYPKEWIEKQKCYSEIYLIRAFLMNNNNYKIMLFNNFLQKMHGDLLNEIMPILMKTQGGSLWLRKQ